MTSKRLWLLSLLLGVITAIVGYSYLSSLETAAQAEVPWTEIYIAKVDIPPETRITEDMIALKKVDARYMPPQTISNPNEVIGKINRWRILQGEAIVTPRLADPEKKESKLAYKIPEGYRAITIVNTPIIGVGGFIKAGDRVDIVTSFTQIPVGGEANTTITKILLENVLVLAVGVNVISEEAGSNGSTVEAAETITFALTPKDAERLILMENMGEIRLLLRPLLEEGTTNTPGATPETILQP